MQHTVTIEMPQTWGFLGDKTPMCAPAIAGKSNTPRLDFTIETCCVHVYDYFRSRRWKVELLDQVSWQKILNFVHASFSHRFVFLLLTVVIL